MHCHPQEIFLFHPRLSVLQTGHPSIHGRWLRTYFIRELHTNLLRFRSIQYNLAGTLPGYSGISVLYLFSVWLSHMDPFLTRVYLTNFQRDDAESKGNYSDYRSGQFFHTDSIFIVREVFPLWLWVIYCNSN